LSNGYHISFPLAFQIRTKLEWLRQSSVAWPVFKRLLFNVQPDRRDYCYKILTAPSKLQSSRSGWLGPFGPGLDWADEESTRSENPG